MDFLNSNNLYANLKYVTWFEPYSPPGYIMLLFLFVTTSNTKEMWFLRRLRDTL